jgi:hypothetical protein
MGKNFSLYPCNSRGSRRVLFRQKKNTGTLGKR